MYQKYHTEAIVLGGSDRGEADRVVVLMTRDFGLVHARATSIRSEHSKMRYAAQNYSYALVSLVKGKRGWRLAGATARALPKSSPGLSAFVRMCELTQRLVAGEEKNEYLFEVLAEAHRVVMDVPKDVVPTVEIVSVARILFALGYISAEALQTTLFTHTQYESTHLQEAEVIRETMLKSINRAIAETHL
ncbi:MAG: recombination protein O N-terminal domain-containing protein [Candidatus Pacebacteria bacterium]|nr:recombination protein O N-terminal domain-containing protein [Candidatus Paceibacterota bacterium]